MLTAPIQLSTLLQFPAQTSVPAAPVTFEALMAASTAPLSAPLSIGAGAGARDADVAQPSASIEPEPVLAECIGALSVSDAGEPGGRAPVVNRPPLDGTRPAQTARQRVSVTVAAPESNEGEIEPGTPSAEPPPVAALPMLALPVAAAVDRTTRPATPPPPVERSTPSVRHTPIASDRLPDLAERLLEPMAAVRPETPPQPPGPARVADIAVSSAAIPMPDRQLDLARDMAWLDGLARDIVSAGEGRNTLRFALLPPTLGRMDVDLRASPDGMQVQLTTQTETARAIVADAEPRLTEQLRGQGMRVADTQVSSETAREQSAQRSPHPAPGRPIEVAITELADASTPAAVARDGRFA